MSKNILFSIIVALGLISGFGTQVFGQAEGNSDVLIHTNCFGGSITYTFPETNEPSGLQPTPFLLSCHPVAPQPGDPRIIQVLLLTEPGSGAISDMIVYDNYGQTCNSQACFASDNESTDLSSLLKQLTSNGAVIIGSIPETGKPQDISPFFGVPPGTVFVTSDLDTSGPGIPEFPFSFSLVIMFVAVVAVYISIRQKMLPIFKRF